MPPPANHSHADKKLTQMSQLYFSKYLFSKYSDSAPSDSMTVIQLLTVCPRKNKQVILPFGIFPFQNVSPAPAASTYYS